ncbi:MAG TPA: hypothetical protein VEQ63_07490 [Bryobacteraceae bacterium]|nr:hypothetical protein [Bryobacteraceae bacterium]
MERILSELVDRLVKTHGEGLLSVVLYGSAATPDGKDQMSDFNVLCVLRRISPDELEASEPVFRWWREMKNPAPLLMTLEELRTCTDCFPIEFHDIRERHRILLGEDLVTPLEIDDSFYRAEVEHELRAKLLRLRQKAGGVLHERDLLLRLMAGSVSTFCVLFRHALRLFGQAPQFNKRDVIDSARQRFGIDPAPFLTLIDVREGKAKLTQVQTKALFAAYLQQIGTVIAAVDQIEK